MKNGKGLKPVNKALASIKSALLYVFLFSLAINLLMLVSPLYMLQVYDRVLVSGSHATLLFLTIFALVALIVLATLDIVRGILLARLGNAFDKTVSGYLFKNIIEQGGHSQPLRDVDTVRSFLSSPALTAIMDAPFTPLYLALIYILHPMLGHIALAGAIVLFSLALLGEKMTRVAQKDSQDASSQAHRYTDVCGKNRNAVYAMGMSSHILAKWNIPHLKSLSFGGLANSRSSGISAISKCLRFALQVGILGMGAFLVIEQESSPGVMIAASIVMGRGLAPIEASITGWRLVIAARDARERLLEYQNNLPPLTEPLPLPEPKGKLTVQNVIFQFPNSEKPLIRDVSLTINPGEVIGITGPNAAGKSTLGKLLLGLYEPNHGEIRLDGATYSQWDRKVLGPHIGYLPQSVELFPGTIAENISRFTDAEPNEIMQAAQLAGVHEMILGLENGYNFAADNFDDALSGGQRQRIALARAAFGLPKLILLDEPTSSLDAEAERTVAAALKSLKENGATVLVIGHRPALMNLTDKLLVMQNGALAAFGPTNEIMAKLVRPAVQKTGT